MPIEPRDHARNNWEDLAPRIYWGQTSRDLFTLHLLCFCTILLMPLYGKNVSKEFSPNIYSYIGNH